jgi:DNA-binding MarR family transcriptional regulator
MRGTSRREDAAFWVLRLDEIEEADPRDGACFLSRFTKDRNSQTEQAPLRWTIQTMSDGSVAASCKEARNIDVFRRWVEDGLECAEDIAREMGVTKGTVSKLAKKAIDDGWLKKDGRKYVLV